MGNINSQSLEDIWNGEAYQAFRLKVNSASPPTTCVSCAFTRRHNNRLSYMPCLVPAGVNYAPPEIHPISTGHRS
jgi:hypothetical protein